MAGRTPKKRLDYAGWNVDIFDNEPKIDKLLDAQCWDGFGIYFFLCMRAYGSEGYYYRWGYADCATTARKMGGGIGSGTVHETVDYCLQIGLFDKGLFDRWGILTSRGIQRKYWQVAKDRDVKEVAAEFWLLHDDECIGLVKTPLNNNLSTGNCYSPAGNSKNKLGNGNFPRQKESKVKESKVNKDICPIERFEEFFSLYPKSQYGNPKNSTERAYIDALSDGATEDELVEAVSNYADFCRVAGTSSTFVKRPENFLKDCFFEQYLPGNYKKPPPPKQRGGQFGSFEQHDYDFEELERELLNN